MDKGYIFSALVSEKKQPSLASKLVILGMAIALVLTLILLTVPSLRAGTKKFLTLSTTHQPERLTELYFADLPNLPLTYQADRSIPVSFTVHNLEERDMTYRYIVYATTTSPPQIQTVSIPKGVTQTIIANLPATDYGERVPVAVELIDQQQSIHFWVSRS